MKRTVAVDIGWRFDNLSRSHLQSHVNFLRTTFWQSWTNSSIQIKWNMKIRLAEHKRATKNGDINNHIAEHHLHTTFYRTNKQYAINARSETHHSLTWVSTANNIMVKLVTSLWRWLPFRLSKRQSLSTTVLFRTTMLTNVIQTKGKRKQKLSFEEEQQITFSSQLHKHFRQPFFTWLINLNCPEMMFQVFKYRLSFKVNFETILAGFFAKWKWKLSKLLANLFLWPQFVNCLFNQVRHSKILSKIWIQSHNFLERITW